MMRRRVGEGDPFGSDQLHGTNFHRGFPPLALLAILKEGLPIGTNASSTDRLGDGEFGRKAEYVMVRRGMQYAAIRSLG